MRHGESTMLIPAVFLICVVERLEERFFLVIVVLVGLRFRQVVDVDVKVDALRPPLVVHRLAAKGYSVHKRSALLPDLDLELLASFAGAAATSQTRAVLAWRDVIRARR